MKIWIAFFLTFFSTSNLIAQNDEKFIFEVLNDLFRNGQDTILMNTRMLRTYFDYDSITLENSTGFKIPKRIVSDWKKNMEPEKFLSYWNENRLNIKETIIQGKDTIICKNPIIKCLTEKEIETLFEKTKKRLNIYSISKPLFDDTKENALIEFTVVPWPHDFSSEMIILKKVFGKWIIVTRFDFTMS